MTKPKTLDQLQAEKEQAETQLAQEQHKLERLENRKKYLEKGERQKRTHRLCNLGGTIESLAPVVKDLTRTEMTELRQMVQLPLPTVLTAGAAVTATTFKSTTAAGWKHCMPTVRPSASPPVSRCRRERLSDMSGIPGG